MPQIPPQLSPNNNNNNNNVPEYDPSANVLALVEAAVKRLDDLRNAESRRIDEQSKIIAEYTERLATAEAKRIDAIRAVDVNAVAVASQRAADQATVLANQVVQSSEALRGLVATTASAVAQSQQQLTNTLSARITTLEQAQYENRGREKYSDPQTVELMTEVKRLSQSGATVSGQKEGISMVWVVILGAFGLISTLISIGVAIYAFLK